MNLVLTWKHGELCSARKNWGWPPGSVKTVGSLCLCAELRAAPPATLGREEAGNPGRPDCCLAHSPHTCTKGSPTTLLTVKIPENWQNLKWPLWLSAVSLSPDPAVLLAQVSSGLPPQGLPWRLTQCFQKSLKQSHLPAVWQDFLPSQSQPLTWGLETCSPSGVGPQRGQLLESHGQ